MDLLRTRSVAHSFFITSTANLGMKVCPIIDSINFTQHLCERNRKLIQSQPNLKKCIYKVVDNGSELEKSPQTVGNDCFYEVWLFKVISAI